MPWGERLLSLSRPAVSLLVITFYTQASRLDRPAELALYAVGSAFFLVSSALLIGWIPCPPRWQAPLLYMELGFATLLTGVASVYHPGGPISILFSPVAVTIYLCTDRRRWPLFTAALFSAWILSSLPDWSRSELPFYQAGIYGSAVFVSACVGVLIRTLAEQKQRSEQLLDQVERSQEALERAHRQLQESAARQQEMAVLEERQRLARDIHDSVAHTLTALVVQIQAGRRMLERSPEQAAEIIARCEQVARSALQETRQAVRALHPAGLEQGSEVDALRKLGDDFSFATGIQVTVEADPAAAALPPDPERLTQLYRIFQEALTNAHRHGQARTVRARLAVTGGQLLLTISNDGRSPDRLDPGVGFRSMLERARSMDGSLTFTPGPRGLTIRVTIPIRQEAVAP